MRSLAHRLTSHHQALLRTRQFQNSTIRPATYIYREITRSAMECLLLMETSSLMVGFILKGSSLPGEHSTSPVEAGTRSTFAEQSSQAKVSLIPLLTSVAASTSSTTPAPSLTY